MFLLSHWILKKLEKWFAVKKKKAQSLPSALLWLITWGETYLDVFTGQWLHLAAKKIFWVAASQSMKSVMVAVMFSLFCVQNLQLRCTGGVMSGEYELWLQEFAALEELHGLMQCVQENGMSIWTGIPLSGIPSSSLACFNFLLSHFRLTLEFPPDQIRFSRNRDFFVETPS